MANTRGSRKREGNGQGQGHSKKTRRKLIEPKPLSKPTISEAEDEDNHVNEGDEERDGEEGDSQLGTMMLFEEKLKAMKKQKTSSSSSYVSKFRKQVRMEQEKLISSLNGQRTQINSEAAQFSKLFINLIEQTLGSPAENESGDLTDDPSLVVQNHPLFSYQESILSLSKRVIDSAESIRRTFVPTLHRDLELGRGWEKDSTDAVDVLLEGRQLIHDKVLATIVEGYKGDKAQDESENDEGMEQRKWKTTTQKARKGIGKLMNSLNVPLPDSEGECSENKSA
ncbi:hypothetical protein L873DRAFT_1839968 [Choiromyces venosus 120613-1]|uniref:Uncharacterized protein n=1 Tax=Choiromyces venosus 120613-1 TaxID=1336337 RepID=A0A3N4K4G0_9PEZI|nr:hypothetical protein L873DRAFT_1839968 [Choiromyces venosus 120613-1]